MQLASQMAPAADQLLAGPDEETKAKGRTLVSKTKHKSSRLVDQTEDNKPKEKKVKQYHFTLSETSPKPSESDEDYEE